MVESFQARGSLLLPTVVPDLRGLGGGARSSIDSGEELRVCTCHLVWHWRRSAVVFGGRVSGCVSTASAQQCSDSNSRESQTRLDLPVEAAGTLASPTCVAACA